MRSHKKSLFITLLLVAILSFARADFEDIITTISSVSTHPTTINNDYRQTSMEGGAYLYIKGSGFSTRSPDSNIVTVGSEPCPVVEYLTTSTQVVCILPPSETEQSAQVRVFVDENRIGNCLGNCAIYYSYWLTPQLKYVSPNAANPGAEIKYYGRQRVTSSNDIDYVKIGDRRCDASNQNEFNAVEFSAGSDQPGPCNIDPALEAGYYSVSQRNLKNTGVAKKLNTIPTYRIGGDAYDFLVAPAITSISSQVGSSEGQIITIKGSGFSSTAGQNEVSLAGTSCAILSESSSEIQCELAATTSPITETAYHAGLKYETFVNESISSVIAGTATRTSTRASLVGEIPMNSGERFTSKLSGFFKAPVTGNYRFVVTADDLARLYIDKTAGSTSNAEQIVSVSTTPYRFPWVKGQTQESDDIALTAGSYYYIALYHQQYSGSSYATIGVRVPNTLNTVNPTPEVQSIAIDCPTVPEILQFKVSNVNEGVWRIKFDYMSADGRKVEKTVTSANLTFNAEAADVASAISSSFGLSTEITRELFLEDETTTTDPELAVTFVYDVTFKNIRKNGKLPSIESSDLRGTNPSGKVSQTQEPSPALSGKFTITYATQSAEVASNINAWDLESQLRTLGFSDPIQVARYGDADLGAEWRIQFTGDGSTDIVPLTITSALEGCADPAAIQVNVATLQESSEDLYYEVIPSEFLFTAHTTPQITVKSNGILGNCPSFSCDYTIQSTGLPEVIARTFSGSTLSLTLTNADSYTTSNVKVFLGNVACTVSSLSAGALDATCSAPEAGDHFPRVHFNGLGFAAINAAVSAISISATVSSVSPSQVNPNGGSVLTVTGSGFPASLAIAQARGLTVSIGSATCTLQSVTPTQIKCVSGAGATASALSVVLNGKTGSSSSLSLLTTIPTISSASPDNVNPVLQTDIVLTGTNFDSTKDQTTVYLKNATNDKAAECLVSASTTTQITCKLLGAPTGTYEIYAQTSLGYTNTQPFTVETVITGISPSSGSVAGGTTLTITGGSFSDQTTQTLVFVGTDNVPCTVVSSSANQVVCVTGPLKTASLAGTAQRVFVDTRIVETATCPNAANCEFTYSTALTPQVTAFDLTTVPAGGVLTITGSGLDGTAAVTINGASATVTSNTASEIVVTIPSNIVPSETSTVVVNIAEKGDAQFAGSLSNVISVTPALTSISQTTGSSAGVLLTISGAGFQKGATVTVGGTACAIRSLSATSITCVATSSGSVVLSYDTFTNVQCTSGCSLTLDPSQTPTVGTITPLNPTSAPFVLTIQGTKFSTGAPRVALVSKTDSSVIFVGSATANSDTQITASFSAVVAGTYSVEVSVGGNLGSTTAVVNVPLTATATAVDSSIGGGITATITGTGFYDNNEKDKNELYICGFPVEVTQSTPTSLTYVTPFIQSQSLKSYYGTDYISKVLTPRATWSDMGGEASVFDGSIATAYKSSSNECFIAMDIGQDLSFDAEEIGFHPDPLVRASSFQGFAFQGSKDNVNWEPLFSLLNIQDGWNTQKFSNNGITRFRYLRFYGGTSTSKCAISEIYVKGNIFTQATTVADVTACGARVVVNDKTATVATAVNYKKSMTPYVKSFLTRVGDSTGGTELNIRGENFGTNAIVTVDGVLCDQTGYSNNPTTIKCITGPAPPVGQRALLRTNIKVDVPGKGTGVSVSRTYLYADKWSNPNTWGGLTPPREGESVHIPKGQNIILDISPPKLKAIIIEGGLIVENKLQTINLDAEYILINGGRFQLGTEDEPLNSAKVIITLHGNKDSSHLPIFGNKVIANMGGILDIHGRKRQGTWLELDRTANAGDNSIFVPKQNDWAVGDVIVIASSNLDHYESEQRTITAVQASGSTLTQISFAEPLKFRHYSGSQTINGQTVNMRTEVGLLTRTIVIQGDETSEKNQYGCHIMSHAHHAGDDGAVARISYTEVRQAGQAFNMGRYPIHFHMIGNVASSFVIGNAVHHTYNRAITIHGVHQLRVQQNVAYWVKGHTIFIEDGIETYNIIEDNLVINTMASMSLLNTDQTPASFWITNPKNYFRRNRAAGSDRYGFWFDLREHPEGPSATDTICPTGETLGDFIDNQAHSNGRYGLRIFHELIPRTNPCGEIFPYEENLPITAEFKNFLGWKNMRDAVIGERMGAVTFTNITAADNLRAGIEISDGDWSPPFTLQVRNSLIVGSTPDNGDTQRYSDNKAKGLITPKKEYFIARNVQFVNFVGDMRAIETCSHCEHPAATTEGAITSYFEGLKFVNVEQKVKFNAPFREILVDNDGSLTGTTSKGVVTFFYPHLNVPGCIRNEAVYNGLVCDSTVTVRRIEFASLNPFDAFNMQMLDILNVENSANEPNYGNIAFRVKRYSWAAPFVTGFSYKLSWRSRADFLGLTVLPSKVIQTGDKAITLVFNHSEYRETYDLIGATNSVNITNLTTLWAPQSSAANGRTCGDWYHDVEGQNLHVAVTPNVKQDINVAAVKCRLNCPVPPALVEKDGIIRLWSEAANWPNNQIPQDGEDVEIPATWTMKLDIPSASLRKLHVLGDLYFDETVDDLVLTAQNIWVEGQLFIGNSTDERFTKNAKVVLTGTRNTPGLIIGPVQDVSNKVLAVTGNVTMYGNFVNHIWVRLQASAAAGATTITVPSNVDWKVGDEIFIAPSQRSENEFESRTIAAISGGVITLDRALTYYHFGAATATKDTPYGTLDMRTEVGLLTRNIKIEGTDEDHWGARLYVGEIYDPTYDYYFRGRADIDGVELKNVGQANTTLAGLTFELLTTENNADSIVKRSVVRNSQGYSLRVKGSRGITIDQNIFYESYKFQLKFDGSNSNIAFTNNIGIGNRDRGIRADVADNSVDMLALFYSETNFVNSQISGNIFAGCAQHCLIARGGACQSQPEGPWTFANNVVHSGETGWLISDPNPSCNGISHYTGYRLDQGIATFFKSQNIRASNLVIADTKIGISLNTGGVLEDNTILLKDSYIVGVLTEAQDSYKTPASCSNHAGIYVSVSAIGAKMLPPSSSMLPWYKVKSEHIWKSTFTVTGVTFENFNDGIVSGCVNNHLFASNPYASDNSASTFTSNLNLINVGSENLVFFNFPSDDWIGLDDCGGWFCTGISNLVIKDTDGTLAGRPSNLIPLNQGVYDPATCISSTKQNAYICSEKEWGLLTFESLDVDFNTRILSPIYVYTDDGFTNKLNSYMDHGWDGFYTSLKRYSRFHSVVQAERDYKVNFTSTVPNGVRWQLQGAAATDSVTVKYGYTDPRSIRVTDAAGNVVAPKFIQSASETPGLSTGDSCGSHIYEIDTRKITLKLNGADDCKLQASLVNSIQASIRYAITIEEFFAQDGPTQFIDRVAAVLGINPASIRIVEIKSGSTIIKLFLDSSYQDDTRDHDLAAGTELGEWIRKLRAAVESGDLKILGSAILDYSFEMRLVREETPETITAGTGTSTGTIIGIVIGSVAGSILLIGSFILYVKYYRKKRLMAKQIAPLEFAVQKKNMKNSLWVNTENPLNAQSRIDASVDDKAPGKQSRPASPSLSPLTGSITPDLSSRPLRTVGSPDTPETAAVDLLPGDHNQRLRLKIHSRKGYSDERAFDL